MAKIENKVVIYQPEKFQDEIKSMEELKDTKVDLLKDSKGLVIADNKTYEGARRARTEIQKFITHINSKRKYLNRENKTIVDGIAADLLEDMEGRKEELIGKIGVWDAKKAEEKAEEEREEAARKLAIKNAIMDFRTNATNAIMDTKKSSSDLDALYVKLNEYKFDAEKFGEYYEEVLNENELLKSQCQTMADGARQREQEEYNKVKDEYFELFKEVVVNQTIEDMRHAIVSERARIKAIADKAIKDARLKAIEVEKESKILTSKEIADIVTTPIPIPAPVVASKKKVVEETVETAIPIPKEPTKEEKADHSMRHSDSPEHSVTPTMEEMIEGDSLALGDWVLTLEEWIKAKPEFELQIFNDRSDQMIKRIKTALDDCQGYIQAEIDESKKGDE